MPTASKATGEASDKEPTWDFTSPIFQDFCQYNTSLHFKPTPEEVGPFSYHLQKVESAVPWNRTELTYLVAHHATISPLLLLHRHRTVFLVF